MTDAGNSTRALSRTQLRRMLGLASDTGSTRNALIVLAAQPAMIRERGRGRFGLPENGREVLDVLCDPGTSTRCFTAVKEAAKLVHSGEEPEDIRAAANFVYHVAIAAAFAFHGDWISSKAPEELMPFYADLASLLHADATGSLFLAAVDRHGHTP